MNILSVPLVETKNYPPVGSHRHRPEAFHLTFERVQAEPGQVHMGDCGSGVKRRQNIAQLTDMLRVYATWVVLLKKPSQSPVAETLII